MAVPVLRSLSGGKAGFMLCLLLLLFSLSPAALAQEKLTVPVQSGTISIVDLATLNADDVVTSGTAQAFSLAGANPRLGFIGADVYLSVIDFSLGGDVNRIYGVCPYTSAAFTSDQKYLLVGDYCGYGYTMGLTVINATTGRLVRRISLAQTLGDFSAYYLGSVVVARKKAYVVSQCGPLAVLNLLNLRNFRDVHGHISAEVQ